MTLLASIPKNATRWRVIVIVSQPCAMRATALEGLFAVRSLNASAKGAGE